MTKTMSAPGVAEAMVDISDKREIKSPASQRRSVLRSNTPTSPDSPRCRGQFQRHSDGRQLEYLRSYRGVAKIINTILRLCTTSLVELCFAVGRRNANTTFCVKRCDTHQNPYAEYK